MISVASDGIVKKGGHSTAAAIGLASVGNSRKDRPGHG